MPIGQRLLRIAMPACLSFAGIVASAQSFEQYKRQVISSFDANKSRIETDFEKYRTRVNAEFAERMRAIWPEMQVNPAVPKPDEKEPDVPPTLPEIDLSDIPQDNELSFETVINPVIEDEPLPIVPKLTVPETENKTLSIAYYGTKRSLHFNPVNKLKMTDASENSAADMWMKMSSPAYDGLLSDCLLSRKEMSLCDWGYYTFVKTVAEDIYGGTNEAVMLRAYLLSQSGFKVRMGRNDAGRLFLLASFTDDLYDFPYFSISGEHYYLTDSNSDSSLYVLDQKFPNEKSIRMSITEPVLFADAPYTGRKLFSKRYPYVAVTPVFNRNAIDFFNDYPSSCLKDKSYSQWVHYANTPISDDVKNAVYPVLKDAIRGKSQAEAANILINFVQTGSEYKTDEDFWGHERSFFPEETLYYRYSDCEDRAILFSRLVRDLLGLKAVLLYYPGHLASAVAFTEYAPGDYIIVDGTRYLVCDPTYIGADIGITMAGKDNSKAVVVKLD